MSEIRRVKIQITDKEAAMEGCKEAGIVISEKVKDKVLVIQNHGIRTYAGTEIRLVLKEDGTYQLEGDCSKAELEKLAAKIKGLMSAKIIVKAAKKMGYKLGSKVQDKQTIKITLRSYA